jgi:hypothetical protein
MKLQVRIRSASIRREPSGKLFLYGFTENHPETRLNGDLSRSGAILQLDWDNVETETTIYDILGWEEDPDEYIEDFAGSGSYMSPDPDVAKAEFIDYLDAETDLRRVMLELGLPANTEKGLKEFVREHGSLHDGGLVALPANVVQPLSQECYYNAWALMVDRDDLFYCEGYLYIDSCPLPVLHGWCVDADGRIHDPSIPQDSRSMRYGVIFARPFASVQWDRLRSRGMIGILCNWGLLGLSEADIVGGLIKPRAA